MCGPGDRRGDCQTGPETTLAVETIPSNYAISYSLTRDIAPWFSAHFLPNLNRRGIHVIPGLAKTPGNIAASKTCSEPGEARTSQG